MKKKMNLNKSTKSTLITIGMIVVAYIVMTILANAGVLSSLMKGLLVPLCIYAIIAVALNLTVGILGELSLGHAGFMCVGAFSSSFFSLCFKETMAAGPRFFLAIVIGALVSALFGLLIGIPVLRLQGDYLAIVTLAFGEIIKNVINVLYVGRDANGFHFSLKDAMSLNMEADGKVLINGAQGITGTPNDSNFTVGVILLVVTLFIVLNLINSRSGRAIMAIRDNRIAAESIGINITKYKLVTFALTAFLAGIAGVIYSHNFSTLQASKFDYNMSILVLVFVVLGGIGSIRGSVIAAVVLTLIPELLRDTIGNYRMLFYAVILIAMMLITSNAAFKGKISAYANKLKGLVVKEKKGEVK